jgi:polysaccharide biosynthesis/export protein
MNCKFRNIQINKIRLIFYLLLCASILSGTTLFAQWGADTKKDILDLKSDSKTLMQTPTVVAPALEGPVDPDKYYVGPSDVISVNIWLSPPLNFSLTVTPEGTIIVPSVGEIRLVDLKLSEAKKKIVTEIKKKYLTGDPTVTLVKPRKVIVTVLGAVRFPGKYSLDATERIDRAVAEANRYKDEKGESFRIGRNIRLTRHSGEVTRIDIPYYYATKNDDLNPLIREGDEIFVPSTNSEKYVFAVYGAVNFQGSFEFVQGDSLLNAIKLSYGFTAHAIKDSIVLYRYNFQTGRQDITYFNADEIIPNSQQNIPLVTGDRIIVKERPEIREDYKVVIGGEVKYPGTYPITKDSTRLSRVLDWCGGFTEFASLTSAQVYRGTISRQELEIEHLLSMRGNILPEDSAYYLLESELRAQREVVNVDFKKLIIEKDVSQDIILKNGDYISIPSVRKTIYVFGQVVNPGNVSFVDGMDYKYYVQKCSGYTDNARTGDVMIIKRVTRQWLSPKETTIEEGDYIWVPKVIEHSFAYYWGIIGSVASVLSVAVTMILLIVQINK